MMNEIIYEWYVSTQRLVAEATKKGQEEESEQIKEMVAEWKESLETIEVACHGLKEMYEIRMNIQKSFTSEQTDHICHQIGTWYLKWKDKILVKGKPDQHHLGVAKEQLKAMICGE